MWKASHFACPVFTVPAYEYPRHLKNLDVCGATQMIPETQQLFLAVAAADTTGVQESLASGADINATDELGRNALHYAALGPAINAFDTQDQIRLSEPQLEVLRLVCQHDQLSLYSLNAPLPWAGGATLLGLMSWLNMSVEITYLFEFTFGLLDVNAMDEQGATPLMYAARDGNMQVVQRLLGQGAKPDIKCASQKSTIQYSLNHHEILWLCEETLRRTRRIEVEISSTMQPRKRKLRPSTPFPELSMDKLLNTLFYVGGKNLLTPPELNVISIRRNFNSLLQAIRSQDTGEALKILPSLHGPKSHTSPLLVNFSDEAGLAPIHYVCSQRSSPSIEIADALYYAGADMGLYSTLGFTPLHHLARTARDPKKDAKELGSSSEPIQSIEDAPLYVFTLHLIRHLRAPLRATDGRGETPLHSAAEHGASVAVLKAMLECDKEYSGKESVREMRNERGLRPVDVAKTEFIPIFMGELPDILKKPPRPPPIKLPPRTLDAGASAYNSPRSPRPNASFTLVKKASDMSIRSRSSGSSSKSSGERSRTSSLSHRSGAIQWHKPPTIHGMHANPYPSPPSSYSGSPASTTDQLNGSFDVSASAMHVLYNLSLSASALQSYSQPQIDETNVPDLLTISETLSTSRDLAMHVLDHWFSQLEVAKSEYDLISGQIRKAEDLLRRVTNDIELAVSRPHKREQLYKSLREIKSHSIRTNSKTNPDHDHPTSESDARASLETIDSQSGVTNHTQPAALTSVTSKSGRLRFDLSTYVDDHARAELRSHPENDESKPTETRLHDQKHRLEKSWSVLKTAPKILQRANADLHTIEASFLTMGKLFKYVEEAISEAHELVNEAIKLREDQLSVVLRAYHGFDYLLHSSRLSPILERSSDGGHTSPSSISTVTDLAPSTMHSLQTLEPIEESYLLRDLLVNKIDQDIRRLFADVQKAHVWLRVIREVLRGLRRRVYFEH